MANSLLDKAKQTWPVKLVQNMLEAAMLPGDVYQGKVKPGSDDYYNRATDLAGMVMGGSYAAPAMKDAAGMGIRAYHGSPYDFDKFSLSKIGTGEGAQAYGHGLYFAENPKVAQAYRDTLSGPSRVNVNQVGNQDPQQLAIPLFRSLGQRNGAMQARKLAESFPEQRDAYLKAAEIIERGDPYAAVSPGRMYEVNINANPEQFLDWDKPLSAQGGVLPNLRQANLASRDGIDRAKMALESGTFSGGDFVNRLTLDAGKEPISLRLREAGIPGIKYLDQGSRGAGDGSRNYVVFDDSLVDILRKYGWMLPAPAAAGAGNMLMQRADPNSL